MQLMHERQIVRNSHLWRKPIRDKSKTVIPIPSREGIISIFACHGQVFSRKLAAER